jgi:hypothetical protein
MNDGWDALDGSVNPKQIDEITVLYGKVFKTSEGQRVLAHLRQMTVDQPVFVAGEDPSFGYVRAGRCEIVRMIENRVEKSNE